MNPIKRKLDASRKQIIEDIKRPKTKFKISPLMLMTYIAVTVVIIAVVFVSYEKPVEVVSEDNFIWNSYVSVDDVVAANLASTVADSSDLPVADSVASLALTTEVINELSQYNDSVSTTKPQIITTVVNSRLVSTYIVQSGDSLDSIASKYSISKQTIKWANNLVNDNVSIGASLKILPIDGVLYTVQNGDNIASIASRYQVEAARIITYNDLEVSGLVPGTNIVLPGGILPEEERPGYVNPVWSYVYSYSTLNLRFLNAPYNYYPNSEVRSLIPHITDLRQRSEGNKMSLGNCTWWAWERRKALGRQLPSVPLGNGGDWHFSLPWDNNIEVGAVFEQPGHVGIIENITYDEAGNITSFTTSEMNYLYMNYSIFSRTFSGDDVYKFTYIH